MAEFETAPETKDCAPEAEETKPVKRKWDKERWREYHRERYRRVHNVKVEYQKRLREQVKEDLENQYGPGAYQYHLAVLKRQKAYKEKFRVPRHVCPVCKVEVCGTDGRWKQHNNTNVHKAAKETLEKHGIEVEEITVRQSVTPV